MTDQAIECDGVCKRFTRGERAESLRDAVPALLRRLGLGHRGSREDRQFWALQEVSFAVERGTALGVIGPNGAGKSTLLRILSSILVPDHGRVEIRGRLSALIEVGAGFHPDLTGRENIYLNGAILGMSRREISSKIDRIVEFAGVEQFLDTPVKRYSSGMQARLGFSVAAHMDPDILLIDEVLAVGDATFQQRCLDKMRYFAGSGRSIVFISHNLQAVAELCPQTLLLMNGRVEFLGPTALAIQHYVNSLKETTAVSSAGSSSIQRVRLLDETGQECNSYRAGDTARLSFDLTLDRHPSQYLLGLAFKRITDGLIAADYNLPLPDMASRRSPAPMTIDFDVNFLTGSYCVVLFLLDRATYDKLAYLDFVKIFDVTEPAAYAGLVHVRPRLMRRVQPELQTAKC